MSFSQTKRSENVQGNSTSMECRWPRHWQVGRFAGVSQWHCHWEINLLGRRGRQLETFVGVEVHLKAQPIQEWHWCAWQISVLEYFLATALHQSFAKPVLSTTRGVSNASPLPVDSYLLCWVNMHCTIRWLDTRYEVHLGAELAREWRCWLPEWSTTSLGHRSELHIMYKESELATCFYFWNKLNQHLCVGQQCNLHTTRKYNYGATNTCSI